MRSASVLIALAAFTGMAVAAKRGCRRDPANPGKGFYYVVLGDEVNSIAVDFGTTADEIAKLNGLANPDFIAADTTIVVPCA
ncbi:hypothetical protein LZ30DRAFT_701436 [Colletotrichum cereale]|nr:hypothetical protein LZ30DRAFT_701436 [Colletotrichum cereale]